MKILNRIVFTEKGASAVEFALVLPFLLLVIFCIFDLAWIMASQSVLNHATFQAARTASAAKGEGDSDSDAAQLAKTKAVELFWMGSLEEANVSVAYDTSGTVPQIQVTTSFPYESLTGWFDSGDIPDTLRSKAVTPLP